MNGLNFNRLVKKFGNPRTLIMSWKEIEDYLTSISSKGINPRLDRMSSLMQLLDHPERKFKSVHVTGTNGKGSICAMLESILRSAGIKTGLYVSPHLINLGERISVCGKKIGLAPLSHWIQKIQTCAKSVDLQLTYFEFLTAVAFSYFADKKVELAVVEVGLGGRWDATNVLPPPETSVLTNVSLEHTDYLGKTVFKIAKEKAGIIKKNSPCVTAATGNALKTIQGVCKKNDLKLIVMNGDFSNQNSQREEIKNISANCGLKGNFQLKNIPIVLKVVELLRKKKWTLSNRAVVNGLKNVKWPGRFEWKMIQMGDHKIPLLMDGAHNPAAIKELVSSIGHENFSGRNSLLIFNALKDKDVVAMVSMLSSSLKLTEIFIPSLNTERTLSPQFVKKLFEKENRGIKISTFNSVSQMFNNIQARKRSSESEWILMTGSFHLIGETLKNFSHLLENWSKNF